MGSTLTPAKVLLLAVHLAAHADVAGLDQLVGQYPAVLHKHVLLRIILTHLPETVNPDVYVGFLQAIAAGDFIPRPEPEVDTSPVSALSDQQASKRANKLHLAQLACPDAPSLDEDDAIGLFLFHRVHRMDTETGMLAHLPDLLVPFINHSPALRTWIVSTVLPFVRRNVEYYAETSPGYSLAHFQKLHGPDAVLHLLARSGSTQSHLGRDLRGLVGPWLYENTRWIEADSEFEPTADPQAPSPISCPGWEQVLEWLASQAVTSWELTTDAVEQWDGPADVYFGHGVSLKLQDPRQRYLEQTYAKAVLASTYMMQQATADSLGASYRMCAKMRSLLGLGQDDLSLQDALGALPDMPTAEITSLGGAQAANHMRNGLLQSRNPLTSPSDAATGLLMTLALSAFIFTRLGVPYTVKRAGELVFLGDEREQRSEVGKLFHAMSTNAQAVDEDFWIRTRRELLWLRDWGRASTNLGAVRGALATVPREHIESEFLKSLLAKSHYALARRLFEDGVERPLATHVVQEVVFNSALNAFDNASNPNRTRGGLRQCDDIIHAFPMTVTHALSRAKRIQALLKATHALSDYRLVLKQGEPFSPVVLRVHSDPISIIDKVLQQNPKAYTRLQEFVEMGLNMVRAGLPSRDRSHQNRDSSTSGGDTQLLVTERRIVAMCAEAALREDDFETAYSYVQPTHLGTASGNPEIRHLEQRMECLATALRGSPTCQLQDILKSFRRCEEQLDSAIKEEAANEAAWDARADLADLPGTFDAPPVQGQVYPPRNMTASAAARQAEEAPMSLFDLSRATARIAQRNITGLSSFQGIATGGPSTSPEPPESENSRVSKRDQLREAATGTLVSSVGWLIGVNMNQSRTEAS
ncbi:Secretory pathway Sec39 [Ophiocordyceps sinensis CO18]|uniref:Secretory pathway Sec39 n=1 Tax=Ophiocordyceps sinensis (strain Co18 / CGMCC 3.14243) TaxID=911162 RepID=T5AD74_OPHSC|nr:Secretory pathway Sec39 [Ophiocordyceps sinensis CO18]